MEREFYTVTRNKFHGGNVVYTGYSLNQAVKAARKIDCSGCKCGGPGIQRKSDGAFYFGWQAGKPFVAKENETFWFTD